MKEYQKFEEKIKKKNKLIILKIIAPLLSLSFILNNLDIIGIERENPIPWLSISHLTNKFLREEINDVPIEISKKDAISAKILIDIPENILNNQIHDYVTSYISKNKSDNKLKFIDKKNTSCDKILKKILTVEEEKSSACELNILTAKDVVFFHKNKYFKKDFRIDNIHLKMLSSLSEKINPLIQNQVVFKLKDGLKIIDLSNINTSITNQERGRLILYNEFLLYKSNIKKNNILEKKSCEEIDIAKPYFVNVKYECEMVEFQVVHSVFKDTDGKYKVMSIALQDIYFNNIRLKM